MDLQRIMDREGVYPVSEDTHLLAESIEVALGDQFLEIGCGTGYVSLSAAAAGATVTGVDINPRAVELSRENASLLGVGDASFFESDLFSEVEGTFDVIAFNPPYLPSEDIQTSGYDACWDGGPTGREVTSEFIRQMPAHLEPNGRVYLLQSSLCNPDLSRSELEALGFDVETVSSLPLFFEQLLVLCAKREHV